MKSTKFNLPMPDGYKKVFAIQDLAGGSYRKAEIEKAFSGKDVELGFELEPNNQHDKNAIKIIAFKKKLFGGYNEIHIGYMPADTAAKIYEKGLQDKILPSLREVWFGDRGGVTVRFDIITPKK